MTVRSELYTSRLKKFTEEVTVYPVSCARLANGRSDEQWLDQVLKGGAKIVQLRDKESDDKTLLDKAKYFRSRTHEFGALLIINDRVDIALLAAADGVHVGQKDIPSEEVRRLAPDMLIGISCNTKEQVKELGELERKSTLAASYYNIGPIYPTSTKEGLSSFLGPEAISLFSSYCTLPFTVMGGIKFKHIRELIDLGVQRIAVVTAISMAANIIEETAKWVDAISKARGMSDE